MDMERKFTGDDLYDSFSLGIIVGAVIGSGVMTLLFIIFN